MKKTISREKIVEAAFQIIRNQGWNRLSARSIADELGSSTMPIYSTIKSMKELYAELGEKTIELFIQYVTTSWTGKFLVDMSYGYVRFAKEEKELFRIMFFYDTPPELADYNATKPRIRKLMGERLKNEADCSELSEQQIYRIIDNLEIIIHGMASLINYGRLGDDGDQFLLQYIEEISKFFLSQEIDMKFSLKPKTNQSTNQTVHFPWYAGIDASDTTRSWPKKISSTMEVPKVFLADFPTIKGDFPFVIFIPEEKGTFFIQRNNKLIYILDENIILLEENRNMIEKNVSKVSDVLYIEYGKVLLDSWIRIVTRYADFHVRFSTIADVLFERMIDMIREGVMNTPLPKVSIEKFKHELDQFEFLKTPDYAYMNFGRRSIRSGDRVESIAYQRQLCIQDYKLFNLSLLKKVATPHLSILTDNELILLKENKQVKIEKESTYKGITTFIPLQNIKNISFSPIADNGLRLMEIQIPCGNSIKMKYESVNKDISVLNDKLKSTIGKN
ncbi:MAG: TetR/AcrR family transcriptional regulator [Anaerolineales bacterium]|nr:TetR/AcrR family transcriptional regulator [Anaerolineales bacterium]